MFDFFPIWHNSLPIAKLGIIGQIMLFTLTCQVGIVVEFWAHKNSCAYCQFAKKKFNEEKCLMTETIECQNRVKIQLCIILPVNT